MGIPTGPQQGGNPGRGGLPTGRTPGSQQPGQQRGLPPQNGAQRPAQPRRESGLPGIGGDQPRQPQQRPARAPSSNGDQQPRQAAPRQAPQQPTREQPPRQPVRQPVREQPQALPEAADEQFDDPFQSFDGENEDLFSDVPRGYQDEDSSGNSYDDEDPFSSADPEEEDEEEAFEPEPEPQRPAKEQKVAPAAKPRRFQGSSRAPQRSKSADEEYSEEFVDRKNLKLKPFGKDSKKRAKVGDFDQRKNLEGQRKLYRGIFIAAVVAVVGFGFYQTFWPQQTLSVAEVQNIAALQSGETGFPTTKGEGFAISFVDSLLTVDPADENSARRSAALSYFYGTGDDGGNDQAFSDAMTTVGSVRQQVVYGPVALDSTALTANAASYEVGVLLSTSDKATDAQDAQAEADSLRWVAFNVNVYYDEKNDSFAIAPNSPTLMPAPAVKAPSTVPDGEPLGESIDDYPESVKATVTGFLDGYRQSSKGNIDKILQYIGTDADESLRDGLNGRYQFATPDDPSTSIEMQVYKPEDTSGELKVLLKVDWQIPVSGESNVTLPSHYVLTLSSQGGGDYTVTKFAPYYWTEATSTDG